MSELKISSELKGYSSRRVLPLGHNAQNQKCAVHCHVCGGTCTSTLFRRLVRHNTLQDGRIHYSRALFGSDGESLQHEFSDEQ
jgi:hypothetical protein